MKLLLYFYLNVLLVFSALSFSISDYYSPENSKREKRKRTDYIILHTTEGGTRGALRKVHESGAIHYLINRKGHVYRIIHKDRIAEHAGTSMWNGRTKINNCSVGIEMVGYHDENLKAAQYESLKELLRQLQSLYNIPDKNVLTHSMVAYGEPNRWHKKRHRGRKRCGMLFALDILRRKIGLEDRPHFDPDVKSKRLVVADKYLANILYGSIQTQRKALDKFKRRRTNVINKGLSAWDIARDNYNKRTTLYIFPNGKRMYGNQIKNWKTIPPGTKVITESEVDKNEVRYLKVLGVDGDTASELAGKNYNSETTIYFFPKGDFLYGHMLNEKDFQKMPLNTKVLVGYSLAGKITGKTRAFDILNIDWDKPSVYYRYPNGKLLAGNQVKDRSMPENSLVFFRS